MSWSFTIMRVRGIAIRVHATFALILIWAAVYWSTQTDAGGRGALFGIVATLLLFVCVLLHELGHSLVAMRYGIQVDDITLLPIGGVARIEIPENPKQEFWIAIAGPAVNVVIAVFLLLVGAILQATSVETPSHLIDSMRDVEWSGLLAYLTLANLLLVGFNILPAFPMDGGRILRAALAMRMDYRRATSIASKTGQGMAFFFGFFGFLSGNFFLLIIAVFIWFGAAAEEGQVAVKNVLGRLKIGDAMIRQPEVLSPRDPLSRAVDLTLSTSQADFPVTDEDGRLLGMLTADHLLKALHDHRTELIGVLMRRDIRPVSAGDPLDVAQERFAQGNVRALPVTDDDGRLQGLLTASDIGEAFRILTLDPDLRPAQSTDAPWPPADDAHAGAIVSGWQERPPAGDTN